MPPKVTPFITAQGHAYGTNLTTQSLGPAVLAYGANTLRIFGWLRQAQNNFVIKPRFRRFKVRPEEPEEEVDRMLSSPATMLSQSPRRLLGPPWGFLWLATTLFHCTSTHTLPPVRGEVDDYVIPTDCVPDTPIPTRGAPDRGGYRCYLAPGPDNPMCPTGSAQCWYLTFLNTSHAPDTIVCEDRGCSERFVIGDAPSLPMAAGRSALDDLPPSGMLGEILGPMTEMWIQRSGAHQQRSHLSGSALTALHACLQPAPQATNERPMMWGEVTHSGHLFLENPRNLAVSLQIYDTGLVHAFSPERTWLADPHCLDALLPLAENRPDTCPIEDPPIVTRAVLTIGEGAGEGAGQWRTEVPPEDADALLRCADAAPLRRFARRLAEPPDLSLRMWHRRDAPLPHGLFTGRDGSTELKMWRGTAVQLGSPWHRTPWTPCIDGAIAHIVEGREGMCMP